MLLGAVHTERGLGEALVGAEERRRREAAEAGAKLTLAADELPLVRRGVRRLWGLWGWRTGAGALARLGARLGSWAWWPPSWHSALLLPTHLQRGQAVMLASAWCLMPGQPRP